LSNAGFSASLVNPLTFKRHPRHVLQMMSASSSQRLPKAQKPQLPFFSLKNQFFADAYETA